MNFSKNSSKFERKLWSLSDLIKQKCRFSAAYEDKAVPNEDFGAGNDVVIFTDGNYCRARIMKSFNNGESFQVRSKMFPFTTIR